MNSKNFIVSTLIFISFIVVIGSIGYFSWRYLQSGLQKQNTLQLNTPQAQTEDSKNIDSTKDKKSSPDIMGFNTNNKPTAKPNSSGIDTEPNTPVPSSVKPVTQKPSQVLGTTTQVASFSIPKPKVYTDDDYVIYDYTFNLNTTASTKLSNGMTYEIAQDSCEKYFDKHDEVFSGSFARGEVGNGIGIKFEIPEGVIETELVKTSYTIYDHDDVVTFTGTTWAPKCD